MTPFVAKPSRECTDTMLKDKTFSDLYLNDRVGETPPGYQWKIDGEIVPLPDEHFEEAYFLLDSAKTLRRPVFALRHEGVRYRGQAFDHLDGLTVVLRRLRDDVPRWSELGFPPGVLSVLLKGDGSLQVPSLLKKKAGLVIVSGETDSGKSTTLAALMKELLDLKRWVGVTIEDPVEYPLGGTVGLGRCYQKDVAVGQFSETLREILRINPDVIMLGEVRDAETASTCLSAAITGHLVMATVHAASVAHSISRLVNLASQLRTQSDVLELAANCLVCGIYQKLERVSGGGRALQADVLFNTTAVRGLIHNNRMEHLAQEVETQRSLLRSLRPAV